MISITIPKLPNFQKALKNFPEIAAPEIKKALESSAAQIIRETIPLTPRDTGRLWTSIGNELKEGILKIEKSKATIGTRVNYAIHVHEGFQHHKMGQRKFLETGAKKAMTKIQGFFKDALDNTFERIKRKTG